MKNFLMLTAFILLSAVTIAQSNKEDIAIVQNMFGKDKKELVQAYMTIPEAKKAGFWTMYDEYEESRKKLGRERIAVIQDYANAYDSLNDKKASDLRVEFYSNSPPDPAKRYGCGTVSD